MYPQETIGCDSSYGTDTDNIMPNPTCPPTGTGTSTPLGRWDQASLFYTDLVPTYISTLPADPINDNSYYYRYEPSKTPARQCFLWEYWTESGGRTNVPNNIGDLSSSTNVPPLCDF